MNLKGIISFFIIFKGGFSTALAFFWGIIIPILEILGGQVPMTFGCEIEGPLLAGAFDIFP